MSTLNLTLELERLIADISRNVEELSHIDPAKIMVCVSTTRGRGIHGTYAKIHPLRFQGGSRTILLRRKRQASLYEIPPVKRGDIEILYLVYFLVPRFLNLSLREKLITVFHELYHVSPAFDGDIRRFPGKNFAHGSSRKKFNAHLEGFVESYLEKVGDLTSLAFLEGNMEELRSRHGAIVARRMAAPRLRIVKEKSSVMTDKSDLHRTASLLALITVVYNLLEGIVSVSFGMADDTISLFGFGLDSFVEVASGIGVWHMIRRMKAPGATDPDAFEQRALRITGSSFYILAVGLVVTAAIDVIAGHRPETTVWGMIVAAVSIVSMQLLIHYKVKVGKALDSPAILADAACTKACLYLSVILLVASAGYQLTGIGWLDSVGAAGIAWFSLKEGRESFQKARGFACCCAGECSKDM